MKAFPITCAVLLSLSGGALLTPVYANEDPILLEDGSTPTCSSGTANVCWQRTTDTCTAYQWVGYDGSVTVPRGGSVGVKLECKTKEVETQTKYYSN